MATALLYMLRLMLRCRHEWQTVACRRHAITNGSSAAYDQSVPAARHFAINELPAQAVWHCVTGTVADHYRQARNRI